MPRPRADAGFCSFAAKKPPLSTFLRLHRSAGVTFNRRPFCRIQLNGSEETGGGSGSSMKLFKIFNSRLDRCELSSEPAVPASTRRVNCPCNGTRDRAPGLRSVNTTLSQSCSEPTTRGDLLTRCFPGKLSSAHHCCRSVPAVSRIYGGKITPQPLLYEPIWAKIGPIHQA